MTDITRTLEILDKLVAFPTVSRDSNLDLIGWVQDLLQNGRFLTSLVFGHPIAPKRGYLPVLDRARRVASVYPPIQTSCLSMGKTWRRLPFQLTDEGERVLRARNH